MLTKSFKISTFGQVLILENFDNFDTFDKKYEPNKSQNNYTQKSTMSAIFCANFCLFFQ